MQPQKWYTYQGSVDVDMPIRKAMVEGMVYLWETNLTDSSATLLWRNTRDGTENIYDADFSGAVICQGRPTDKTTKAVLFQNFQDSITT